jgi:hypothetical protein
LKRIPEKLSPVKIKLRDYFSELKIASQTLKNGARNLEPREVLKGMNLHCDSMEFLLAVHED